MSTGIPEEVSGTTRLLVEALESCEKGARTVFYGAVLAAVPFLYILYVVVTFDPSRLVDVRQEAAGARFVTRQTGRFVALVGGLSQRKFVDDYRLLLHGLLRLQDLPWSTATAEARKRISARIGLAPDSIGKVLAEGIGASSAFLEIYVSDETDRPSATATPEPAPPGLKPEKVFTFSYEPPRDRYEITPLLAGVWKESNPAVQRRMPLQQYESIAGALNFYFDHWRRLLTPDVMGTMLHPQGVAIGDSGNVPVFLLQGAAETLLDYEDLRHAGLPFEAERFCEERGLSPNLAAMENYTKNLERLAESLERNQVGEIRLPFIAQSVALPFVFLIGNLLLLGLIGAGYVALVRRRAVILELNSTRLSDSLARQLELGRHPWVGTIDLVGWDRARTGLLLSVGMTVGMIANCVSAGMSMKHLGFRWEAAIGEGISLLALAAGTAILAGLGVGGYWRDRVESPETSRAGSASPRGETGETPGGER